MQTPYFPSLRSRLAALGRRTAHRLRQATLGQLQDHLRDLLPAPLLSAEDQGPNSRQRVFTLRLTFECFLWQVLKPKTSCREVVRQVQGLLRLAGGTWIDEGDWAFVQARQRLPRERLEKALGLTAQAADRRAGAGGQLRGRPVKVADGSTTQLADTQQNQKVYPQPSTQKRGCGFPMMKFVVLFSLCSGAVLKVMLGNLHSHDLRLLRALWEQLNKGDILLGDRAYGEYTTLAGLPRQGVDVVARLHQARKVDFRDYVAKHPSDVYKCGLYALDQLGKLNCLPVVGRHLIFLPARTLAVTITDTTWCSKRVGPLAQPAWCCIIRTDQPRPTALLTRRSRATQGYSTSPAWLIQPGTRPLLPMMPTIIWPP